MKRIIKDTSTQCEACLIEGRLAVGIAVELLDGVPLCKEHSRIYERIIVENEFLNEEDE